MHQTVSVGLRAPVNDQARSWIDCAEVSSGGDVFLLDRESNAESLYHSAAR